MVGVKRVTPNSNAIYRLGPDIAKMKLTESPAAAYDPLSVDLNLLGFRVPVAWFNSIDSLVSIFSVPALLYLWRRKGPRQDESDEISKIGTGAWIACAANLVLASACLFSKRVSVLAPILYLVLLGISLIYYWPTLLALTSRVAPPAIRATMMGVAFLTQAVANLIIGGLGGLFERMSAADFWTLHAAIAAVGGILASIGAKRLSSALRGGPSSPT